MDLTAFAGDVGEHGPVSVTGLGTRGGPVAGIRVVTPPAGVMALAPDEMTVRCLAGTPVDDLQAELDAVGQEVALPPGGTVGGALAVGRASVLRLGQGPVRNTLLQLRYVSAEGRVIKVGGPTVKNVTGFDLCRLFVGSLGTLGFAGDVILRTWPQPTQRRWFAGAADPFALQPRLHRPGAVLWDGVTTWVCLQGHPGDVAAEAAVLSLPEVEGPPELPATGRASMRPGELRSLTAGASWPGPWVAEVGVGVVHLSVLSPARTVEPGVVELHRRIKAAFDPEGRLNPGRSVLPASRPVDA